MKAYLAAPIFTERDRNFNSYLEAEILKLCPNLDLYLSQNNKSINDKNGCATSADIYVGDVTKLKESDLLISVMSADLPPIGSSYETAYFCGLCENNPNKTIIALYDDCREGSHTFSQAKLDAMLSGIGESQWPYINLLAVGYVKKWGSIYFTSRDLIQAVKQWYDLTMDNRISGIYKITNLKNNLLYIGQTTDFNKRRLSHFRKTHVDSSSPLYADMEKLGLDYFKFDIIEKCDIDILDQREKYWIEYYDSYNTGYNLDTGGSGVKAGKNYITEQTVKVYSYDLEGNFIEEFNSIAEAVRTMGLKSNNITRAASYEDNHHISGNRMWRFKYVDKLPPYEPPTQGYKVYAYDMNTRLFVKAYTNARQAGIDLTGKRQPHINDAANGKRRSCCGFIWAYDYFEKIPENYFNELRDSSQENIIGKEEPNE